MSKNFCGTGIELYLPLVGNTDNQGMKWSLPTDSQAGDWHSWTDDTAAPLYQCMESDWLEYTDVTENPVEGWASGAECYLVETADNGNKARLLHKLNPVQLAFFGIYVGGEHDLGGHFSDRSSLKRTLTVIVDRLGKIVVGPYSNIDRILAYGKARVESHDIPRIEAWDSASLTVSGVSRVAAYGDGVNVVATGAALVSSAGNGNISVSGHTHVTVYMNNSPTVKASGTAIVETTGSGNPTITLEDGAVWIDRRGNRLSEQPTVHTASGVLHPGDTGKP